MTLKSRLSPQNLTTLCHLDQLLLVTHISLSSNQLEQLPPQFAMLQCLEVTQQKIPLVPHEDVGSSTSPCADRRRETSLR